MNVSNFSESSVCLRDILHIWNFTNGAGAVGGRQPDENPNKSDLGSSDNISVLV